MLSLEAVEVEVQLLERLVQPGVAHYLEVEVEVPVVVIHLPRLSLLALRVERRIHILLEVAVL